MKSIEPFLVLSQKINVATKGDETVPAVELEAGDHDARIIGRSQKLEKKNKKIGSPLKPPEKNTK